MTSTPPKLEFFFDCSSPWTYLAFSKIEDLAARMGAALAWRPILVGGVFNEVNQAVYETRAAPVPAKARYYVKDLQDWARHYGLKIIQPSVFPVRATSVQRGCCYALAQNKLPAFARAAFAAYWGDDQDISTEPVLRALATKVGLDADALLGAIASDPIKQELRANTDEVIARGGFGSPTIFLNKTDMYFGNDRLELLEAALARLAA